jgi:hypothetical protein
VPGRLAFDVVRSCSHVRKSTSSSERLPPVADFRSSDEDATSGAQLADIGKDCALLRVARPGRSQEPIHEPEWDQLLSARRAQERIGLLVGWLVWLVRGAVTFL